MDKETVLTKNSGGRSCCGCTRDVGRAGKKITDACIEGGVAAIEMTFTVPQADKVIAELAATYTADQIILGAGTVLDPRRRVLQF